MAPQVADGLDDVGGFQHVRGRRHHPQRLECLDHRLVEQLAEPLRWLVAVAVVVRGITQHLHELDPHLPVLVSGAALGGGLNCGVDGAERREEALPPAKWALLRHVHAGMERRLLQEDALWMDAKMGAEEEEEGDLNGLLMSRAPAPLY